MKHEAHKASTACFVGRATSIRFDSTSRALTVLAFVRTCPVIDFGNDLLIFDNAFSV